MENMKDLFPGESPEKVLAFIKRIKKLVPVTNDNKIDYLFELFEYVDGLINGDDVRQFYNCHGVLSKYAKQAFQEIISDVHETELESFRREKQDLETKINELQGKLEPLSKEVERLETKHQELLEET